MKDLGPKWTTTMQKLLGVDITKTWLCWLIFAIKLGCSPISLIFGLVYFNECTAEPRLPPAMIAFPFIEAPWILFVFYLYVYIPYKQGPSPHLALHVVFLVLSLGMGVLLIMMTVFLAGIDSSRVNFDCEGIVEECTTISKGILYGGWGNVAFKYLDVVKFFIVAFCTFK